MMRVRLKADGRLVEILADGSERAMPPVPPGADARILAPSVAPDRPPQVDAGYARRVRSQTRLTQAELRELYRSSRLVAVPVRDVDFQAGSLVMYEAMACGRPVIATRSRGQEDILEPGETGLYVAPGDADEMRAAISTLLGDPDRAEGMGRRAREVVAEGLNLERYVQRISEILTAAAEVDRS